MYYKVVCNKNGKLESFNRNLQNLCVTYTPGEFTYPNNSGEYLAVFDDLDTAIAVTQPYTNLKLEIWECEIEAKLENPLTYLKRVSTRNLCAYHDKTVLAHGVKLTKLAELPIELKYGDIIENTNRVRYMITSYESNMVLMNLETYHIDNNTNGYGYGNVITQFRLEGVLSMLRLNKICQEHSKAEFTRVVGHVSDLG